jgi:exodeoxyribonuclease-3
MAGKPFRIATFNVNSVRARMPIVTAWMRKHRPDVLCLQETKVQDADFPLEPFEALGYHVSMRGQKAYNGVAIMTRERPRETTYGLDDGGPPDEPRFMTTRVRGVIVLNTYVPQGQDVDSDKYAYKLEWLERLRAWLEARVRPRIKLCWCGDINIAPTEIDIHDPKRNEGHVCFNPEVREAMARIQELGLTDVFRKHHSEPGHYTYFDYRVRNATARGIGWRVDHIHATRALANRSRDAWIDLEPRNMDRPSDHTPLVADFTL